MSGDDPYKTPAGVSPKPKLRNLISKLGAPSPSKTALQTSTSGTTRVKRPWSGIKSRRSRSQSDLLIISAMDSSNNDQQLYPTNLNHRLSDPFSIIESPDLNDALSSATPIYIPPYRRVSFPRRHQKKRLFPRLWDVMLPSPSRKGKSSTLLWPTDSFGNALPLDGEEGELIDDEGCFDVVDEATYSTRKRLDIVSLLPTEIAFEIFLNLDLPSIVSSLCVSRYWHRIATDKAVWRRLFYQQSRWRVNAVLASRRRISSRASSAITTRASIYSRWTRNSILSVQSCDLPLPSLALDWIGMYKTRLEVDRRWSWAEPKVTRLTGHGDSVYCLEFDHNKIITGSRDKQIMVWSLATGKLLATLRGHEGSVLCLKFESSSGLMVSGSSDCRVLVWDLHGIRTDGSARPRAILKGHSGGVLDLRIDAQWIVSCSKDATIRVWSRASLQCVRTFEGHDGPVNAVGLHCGLIVSASGDGKMILWDIANNAQVRVFAGHERGLACVDFHGDTVVSGSNDMTIKVWRASTGECIQTLTGHTSLVRALTFDERMERLVSASYDQSVMVWELKPRSVEDGGGVKAKLMREFKGYHSSHIFDVKFDATRIISSSHDRKIAILDFGADLDTSLFV